MRGIVPVDNKMKIFVTDRTQNINNNGRHFIFLCTAMIWIFILTGCASMQVESDIVALVDGEPITKEDIEYAIQIAHRREKLNPTSNINIAEFIQQLIDERLIVQEARRMGLHNDPQITDKVFSYQLRESVTQLYNEEIVQKAKVSESDIQEYYRDNYEVFRLGFIETLSEDTAAHALDLIMRGSEFGDVAREYSAHASRDMGGMVILERRALSPDLDQVVSKLQSGEVSPITRTQNKYYIIQLIDRSEAQDEGLEKIRTSVEKTVKSKKAKQLGDDYITELYKKYPPDINQELLSSMHLPMNKEERGRWLKDKRVLVRVGDAVLTAGDFTRGLNPRSQNLEARDMRIKQWIETRLVDREAINRHYEKNAEFQNRVNRYANQLIMKEFIDRYIKPEITASGAELQDYYDEHKEDFKKPAQHRIQQITVRTIEEGNEILSSLNQGADFSWLAKTRSIDRFGPKGGDLGWHETGELTAPIKNIIDSMEPGDISPVLEDGSLYRIIKLQDRINETVADFSSIEHLITQKVFKEKYNKLYESYVDKLKKDARIEIDNDVILSLQELFGQK